MARYLLASTFFILILLIGYNDALSQEPRLVRDILENGGADPQYFSRLGTVLYFQADDGTHGNELWRSDGTEAGTWMVKDINPGSAGSYPSQCTVVGGTLFCVATDSDHGRELWRSDGSETGTVLVNDINPGSNSSFPGNIFGIGCQLFFSADDGSHGPELWVLDACEMAYTIYLPLVVRDIR